MAATATTVAAILKTLYKPGAVAQILYKNMPFLGMVKKNTKFAGDGMKVPVMDGGNTGGSRQFSAAQAVAAATTSSNRYDAFTVNVKEDYALGNISRQAMLRSERDDGAFLRALKAEKDGTLYTIKRALGIALWGNGGGAYGRIAVISTTTNANDTVTLSDISQIRYFERGLQIDLSTDDGTGAGAIRAVTTQPVVTSIDRKLGKIVFQNTLTGLIAGAAVNDYMFRQGDYLALGGKLNGVPAWIPTGTVSATAFNGVVRTTDVTRLAGIQSDGTGLPILEALQKGGADAFSEGASPDTWFVHPTQMHKLQIALNNMAMIEVGKSTDPTIGYKGLNIMTTSGTARVVADPDMPRLSAWGLTMDTWCLWSMKEAPHLVDEDGLPMLRQNAADGYEWRLSSFAELVCDAPGMNVVVNNLAA